MNPANFSRNWAWAVPRVWTWVITLDDDLLFLLLLRTNFPSDRSTKGQLSGCHQVVIASLELRLIFTGT